MPRPKMDNNVELRKILRPMGLSTSQYLGCTKVFKVFVISNNVHQSQRSLQIMSQNSKSFKNGKQILVMSVIVQFQSTEHVWVKSHRVDFSRICLNRKNSTKCIVRSISFHNNRSIRNSMRKHRGWGEGRLQGLKRFMGIITKISLPTFMGELCQQNNDVRIVRDEPLIEVHEA